MEPEQHLFKINFCNDLIKVEEVLGWTSFHLLEQFTLVKTA